MSEYEKIDSTKKIVNPADFLQVGRIGLPAVIELAKAGFHVTVLSRNAERARDLPAEIQVLQVDYDSSASLSQALQKQDAVICTIAMSAIYVQKSIIDAAVAAGVRYYVPAEYTVNSRDSKAQNQPMLASVLDVQSHLSNYEGRIQWFVINCGALLEFAFEYPFILDFDARIATLWDGGNGGVSLSNIKLVAQAIVAVLKQPDRVMAHRIKVHGGSITQNRALLLAKQHSTQPWTTHKADSERAYLEAMDKLADPSMLSSQELMHNMMAAFAAATFGSCDQHFEATYEKPDNDWLGVAEFASNEIEEAIRVRVIDGTRAFQPGTDDTEDLNDVAGDIAVQYGSKH